MGDFFKTIYESLPDTLALFPLDGILLLPRAQLPLNIFEPRYKAMVNAALKTDTRLIGMVQPKNDHDLYSTGCAGRISSFDETDDGRYLITLTGVSRFKMISTPFLTPENYRTANVDWQSFSCDRNCSENLDLDRARLAEMLKNYFVREGLSCNWDMIEKTGDETLISLLSMVCPFSTSEKQALLEAPCARTRAELFYAILDMAIQNTYETHGHSQH